MKVLLMSWAGRSHYFSLVPLGWALRAAGHEVRVLSQPGFAGTVTASGLTMTPVGHDVDVAELLRANLGAKANSTEALPSRWDSGSAEAKVLLRARKGLGHFLTLAEVMAGDALAFGRQWRPDLILFEPTTFAGPLLGQLLGVPAVRHLWAPDFTADLPSIETELFADLLARHGLETLGVNGDLTIDPCPPRLQIDRATGYQPMRYVPYNGGGTIPEWLAPAERPRVCVTWGLSQSELGVSRGLDLAGLLRAIARLPIDVVVPTTAKESLGGLPPNVSVVDPVPLQALLQTCDLVVHHGGSGTLMTAMSEGVPQVVLPNMPDLMFNGRQLAGTGAGVVHPATAGIDEVAADIERVLTEPEFRQAAAKLREESESLPSPAEIAAKLEALV